MFSLRERLSVLLLAHPALEAHPLPSVVIATFGKVRRSARTATESKGCWVKAA